jgi:integration host factor subunit beta
MTKSELIEILARKQKHLPAKDVELAVKHLLDLMSDALASGQRIEIRGFGSFSLHYRPPRMGRNPKTGEAVALSGKYVPTSSPARICATASTRTATCPSAAERDAGWLPGGYPVQ